MGEQNQGKILSVGLYLGLNELASPIIAYLKETRTPNDDFVGAPSGKLKTCAHYCRTLTHFVHFTLPCGLFFFRTGLRLPCDVARS